MTFDAGHCLALLVCSQLEALHVWRAPAVAAEGGDAAPRGYELESFAAVRPAEPALIHVESAMESVRKTVADTVAALLAFKHIRPTSLEHSISLSVRKPTPPGSQLAHSKSRIPQARMTGYRNWSRSSWPSVVNDSPSTTWPDSSRVNMVVMPIVEPSQ